MLIFTSAIHGELSQTAFLCSFHEGVVWIFSNFKFLLKKFLLKPQFFRAFSNKGFALLN